uniref:SKP1 component POZ domain-containing protein n=2 Tax=Cyprinus carpio TaxID=7962 RepID=A0A8C2IF50_CYPCA
MPTIKLQSSDGEMFEVDVEIAKQSVTIKTMLEGKMILDVVIYVCIWVKDEKVFKHKKSVILL